MTAPILKKIKTFRLDSFEIEITHAIKLGIVSATKPVSRRNTQHYENQALFNSKRKSIPALDKLAVTKLENLTLFYNLDLIKGIHSF